MKRPVAIPLSPEGAPVIEVRAPRAFAPTEVQPTTERVESYSDPLPDPANLPVAAPRASWLARLLWGTAGLLVSLGLGLALDALIRNLFTTAPWLGWVGLTVLGLVQQDSAVTAIARQGHKHKPKIRRVLKDGGMLLSLDFNRPENALVRMAYHGYLTVVGGALGLLLHRNADTYRYIPESIRRYPGATRVTELLRLEGFSDAHWQRVLGGLMAIHIAKKDAGA